MGSSQPPIVRPAPISTHKAFVPLIAVWVAALLGGIVGLLPAQVIAATRLDLSQLALAGAATVTGGLIGLIAARLFGVIQNRSVQRRQKLTDEVVAEPVAPITIAELEEAETAGEKGENSIIEPLEPDASLEPAPQASDAFENLAPDEWELPPDDPHFADIELRDLLGAPTSESHASESKSESEAALEQYEEQIEDAEFEPVEEVTSETALPSEFTQHGKAVNLLRTQNTNQLAMPQLIERFAVALDEHRQLAYHAPHSYSLPAPPPNMTGHLQVLLDMQQRAS